MEYSCKESNLKLNGQHKYRYRFKSAKKNELTESIVLLEQIGDVKVACATPGKADRDGRKDKPSWPSLHFFMSLPTPTKLGRVFTAETVHFLPKDPWKSIL